MTTEPFLALMIRTHGAASANLRGADLTDADLTGADLTGATLTGADLTGATLRYATLPTSLTAEQARARGAFL